MNSSSSGCGGPRSGRPTSTSASGRRALLDVVGARDRIAVRARGRVAEQAVDRRLDALADHVLPLAGLVMGLGPRQAEDVGEEALGETVAAHDPLGQRAAGAR